MLDTLFNPSAIAIIGASQEVRRPGGQPLHALTNYGYVGQVYAVNPRYSDIDGRPCYPSVKSLPSRCDVAIIALPAAAVAQALIECGQAGMRYAVILSAGFREIGEKGAALQSALEAAIRTSGVRVVGPNCVGVLALPQRLFAGFGAGFRNPDWRGGPIAMISQSGGFAYSIVSFCQEQGLGLDYMVSTGNEADLGTLDFVEHFLADDDVRLIALYLEGLSDGKRLRALGRRALEAGKPIAVWKVGNTQVGKRAAVSHTANLTEDYDFYRDAFAEGGFIEVREVYDLIDAAKAFRAHKLPRGRRVAIVTTSGGAGVLLADRCEESKLELPALSSDAAAKISPLVPDFASLTNPIDVTAALAQAEPQFTEATHHVIEDANVDLAILRSFPGRDVKVWAENLATYSATCAKPILVSLSGTPGQSASWAPALDQAGVACFEAPSRAVSAAAMLCDFAEKAVRSNSAHSAKRPVARMALPIHDGVAALGEHEAKRYLELYGIRTPPRVFIPHGAPVPSLDVQFPVVAKIVSADIAHKTEAGGVRLGVQQDELGRVLAELSENALRFKPDAKIEGYLIEEQVAGLEMIVGALDNSAFGPLVLVGLGGVHAEVFRDVARRYAPVGIETAREMVSSLKASSLLRGYRGQPAHDIDALCDVVSRLSWMMADHQDTLSEIEVNPVIVGTHGRGAYAVDAIVRFKAAT